MADLLTTLARQLANAIRPFATALDAIDDTAHELGRELGYELPSVPPSLAALKDAGERLLQSSENVDQAALAAADGSGDDGQVASAAALLLLDTGVLLQQIEQLRTSLPGELPPEFVAATHIGDDFSRRLYAFLVHTALEAKQPLLTHILAFFGIVEALPQPDDEARFQPEYTLRALKLERLPLLAQDPASVFRDVYGWDTPELDVGRLFDALRALSFDLLNPARIEYPSTTFLEGVGASMLVSPDDGPDPELIVPVLETEAGGVSVVVYPLPRNPPEPQGLAMTVIADAAIGEKLDITPSLRLDVTQTADLSSGVCALLRPGQPVTLVAQVLEDGAAAILQGAGAKLRLTWIHAEDDVAQTVIELAAGSSIAARELYVQLEIGGNAAGVSDVAIETGIAGGRFVLDTSEADSFLASILPEGGIDAPFDVGVGWSSARGFYFSGSATLETKVPVHAQIGPLRLDAIHVALAAAAQGASLEASVDASAAIGPIAASIERIGVSVALAFRDGNLGPLDVSVAFKPPTGIGVAIDAGPITGGGFLSIDAVNHRYAGVLQLRAFDIALTAVGIIDTHLPGSQPGFSFVIVIAGEFPPIQLGYGFTLNGAGGIAGIHRTIDVDAVQAGLRNHTLDHVLFPKDPIRNAPQIVSDIGTVFPPAPNRFVFGPVALIGWGTPTLVSIELGIVIELPAPVRLVLLGQIAAAIPSREMAVVELHIDVLGIIDFEGKRIAIDAALHDSRLAAFPISGDAAFRMSWGDEPNLTLAVGGLNPRFSPPPGFPELRRVTVSLGFEDNPRISVQGYLAVTSNTLQFGARAELYAKAGGFSIDGWVTFDALFQVIPLWFAIDFDTGVALRRGSRTLASVRVRGVLTGPSPYHVKGKASLSLLFFDISVPFERTFGSAAPADRPLIDPFGLLKTALETAANWTAAFAGDARDVITARLSADAPAALLNPAAGARVLERVLPLNQRLDKFGEAVLIGAPRYDVTEVRAGAAAVADWTPVSDRFARAQFQALSDAEKLAVPSFELMTAGVEFGSAAIAAGQGLTSAVTFETRIVDSAWNGRKRPRYDLGRGQLLAMTGSGAIAQAPLKTKGAARFAADLGGPTRLGDELYVVASTADLSGRPEVTAPTSKADARRALDAYLAAHPDARDSLQVVSLHEAA